MGVEYGVIQKTGSWFSYNEDKIGQGRDKTIDLLRNNPELKDEILAKIMAAVKTEMDTKNGKIIPTSVEE